MLFHQKKLISAHAAKAGRSGTRLRSRYCIEMPLHVASMHPVYRARDSQERRQVAVKIVEREDPQFETLVERMRREAWALHSLSHPRIAQLVDVGPCEWGYLLATAYIDGVSLREVLRCTRPLPIDAAVSIIAAVLEALEAVHELGLVHRDVKPENVMLSNSEGVKLVDFGLVTLAPHSRAKRLTEPLYLMGTPAYMAPETCREHGEHVGVQSDLYACGHLLYEMLAGCRAFPEEISRTRMIWQQLSSPVTLFSDAAPGLRLPKALEQVVYTALAKRPIHRTPSARAMRKAILEAVS